MNGCCEGTQYTLIPDTPQPIPQIQGSGRRLWHPTQPTIQRISILQWLLPLTTGLLPAAPPLPLASISTISNLACAQPAGAPPSAGCGGSGPGRCAGCSHSLHGILPNPGARCLAGGAAELLDGRHHGGGGPGGAHLASLGMALAAGYVCCALW